MTVEPRRYRIEAVERSFALLEILAERSSASLAELAELLDAPKGSLFRHLRVLEQGGYVRQTPVSKRYALGPRMIYLGFAARSGLELGEVAAPAMTDLRDTYNETVHLGVVSHGEVVHVGTVMSTQLLKMAAEIGDRTGAHVSALGKAILAFSPPAVVASVTERGLPRYTRHTIVTQDALDLELAKVRRLGFALDDEESTLGLRCVAAPIRDESGAAVGAMSISSPTERLTRQQAEVLGGRLVEVTDRLSRRFGWTPPAVGSAPAPARHPLAVRDHMPNRGLPPA